MSANSRQSGHHVMLLRALGITEDDILANQDGFITKHQQTAILNSQRYRWAIRRNLWAFVLLGVLFVGVGLTNRDFLLGGVFMCLIFLSLAAIIYAITWLQERRIVNEMKQNTVKSAWGKVLVKNVGREAILEIEGLHLHVPSNLLRIVKNRATYRVYYLPKSNVLLSIEPDFSKDEMMTTAGNPYRQS